MVCVSGQEDDGVIHESESDVCEAWERGGRESCLGSVRVRVRLDESVREVWTLHVLREGSSGRGGGVLRVSRVEGWVRQCV